MRCVGVWRVASSFGPETTAACERNSRGLKMESVGFPRLHISPSQMAEKFDWHFSFSFFFEMDRHFSRLGECPCVATGDKNSS